MSRPNWRKGKAAEAKPTEEIVSYVETKKLPKTGTKKSKSKK